MTWRICMTGIEILGFISACLTTVAFFPQAYQVWKTKDTESLSLAMYSILTLGILCWLIYGAIKQDNAIMIANIITFILSSSILSLKVYNDVLMKKLPKETDIQDINSLSSQS